MILAILFISILPESILWFRFFRRINSHNPILNRFKNRFFEVNRTPLVSVTVVCAYGIDFYLKNGKDSFIHLFGHLMDRRSPLNLLLYILYNCMEWYCRFIAF